jgi:hypothetical protein
VNKWLDSPSHCYLMLSSALQADPLGTLTVRVVTERVSSGPNTTHLHRGLRKWVQACGIAGDPDSACITELLPHYATLLTHLASQHNSKQLTATTAYRQLLALNGFLSTHRQVFEDGSVDYAAMLHSIDAAREKYLKASNRDAKAQMDGESLCGRKRKAAAPPAWAAAYQQRNANSRDAAPGAGAAADVAGSIHDISSSMSYLNGQQQQQQSMPLSAPVPPAAAAAGSATTTAAAAAAATLATSEGTAGTVAAAAAPVLQSNLLDLTDISMADLLQQLQSNTGLVDGTCIRHMQQSAACFGDTNPDTIPASLLLTSYFADLSNRAQQCLNAVGQQAAAHTCAGGECLALLQEVEGLLQLSLGQPVLLQLLGEHCCERLQGLVAALLRCKQLLGDGSVTP